MPLENLKTADIHGPSLLKFEQTISRSGRVRIASEILW